MGEFWKTGQFTTWCKLKGGLPVGRVKCKALKAWIRVEGGGW
jgi:hypothetical protein